MLKDMNSNKTLSVWLLPNNNATNYSSIIQNICHSLGKEAIIPHITLASSFNNTIEYSLEKLNQLFSEQKSFLVKPNGFFMTNYYFKSLCMKIAMDDTMKDLRNRSLQHFNCKERDDYVPHMSLVYGNFEESNKKKVIEEYGRLLSKNRISISSIGIAENNEENLNWKIIEEIYLND